MLALKAHLTPLIPDNTGLEVLERFKEESRPELSLEDGFRAALATLRQLVLGERGKEGEGGMEVPSETLAEVGRLEDENKALQSRCEDLESALADARCVYLPRARRQSGSYCMCTTCCRFDLERSVSRAMRLERQLADAKEHIQTSTPQNNDPTIVQQATPTSNNATTPSSSTAGETEEVHMYVL